MEKRPQKRSFLLTAWEERSQNAKIPPFWRFGLEDVHNMGRRRVFATLEEVMHFLKTETQDQTTTLNLDTCEET